MRKRIREDYYGTFREAKASRSGKSKTLPARDQRLYTYAAEVIAKQGKLLNQVLVDQGFARKR